jgi:formylglycine-generating enzyme required for sulfatase activity
MGSSEYETGHSKDEPQSQVSLSRSYWLATHEVTQELWTRVMGSNPSYFANCGSQCPVERVSWFDTIEFMNRLSLSEGRGACYATHNCTGTPGSGTVVGKQAPVWGRGDYECSRVDAIANCTGYRFPTEAEWEFAARANTTTATYNGNLDNLGRRNAPNLGRIAWYAGNAVVDYEPQYPCADWTEREVYGVGCGPKSVGLLPANTLGLYDTMGNVWEWTGDWWGTYRPSASADPRGPSTGDIRVFKGGSWRDDAALSRAASRRGSKPQYRYGSLGIRLARNQP